MKEYIRDIKVSSGCMDCHVFYPYYVLQFDHRPDTTKLYNISAAFKSIPSMKALQEEIDKCDIVCANCHAERTYSRRTM